MRKKLAIIFMFVFLFTAFAMPPATFAKTKAERQAEKEQKKKERAEAKAKRDAAKEKKDARKKKMKGLSEEEADIILTEDYQGPKIRVAVMDFKNKTVRHWGAYRLGMIASDLLITTMVESGRFSVIERQQINLILNEQGFGQSGAVTAATAAKVGSILGIPYILTGAVTELSASTLRLGGLSRLAGGPNVNVNTKTVRAGVDCRIIDVNTAEILAAKHANHKKTMVTNITVDGAGGGGDFSETFAQKALREAIRKMVAQLIVDKEMSPGAFSAKIIKADAVQVYINAGANMGLEKGMALVVKRKGEALVDPDTGLDLGAETSTIGELIVTDVKEKFAICRIQSGTGFLKGDICVKKSD